MFAPDEVQQSIDKEYDDSPWTREELEALAWQIAERENWEDDDSGSEQVIRRNTPA